MPQKKKKPSKVSKEDIKHTDPLVTLTQKKIFLTGWKWLKKNKTKQQQHYRESRKTNFFFVFKLQLINVCFMTQNIPGQPPPRAG